MPRFSANISMLFCEHDLVDRPRAAKHAGFESFEVQFPYGLEIADWLDIRRRSRMPIALFNVPAGDLTTGGQGLAAIPGREHAFQEAVATAARYAEALKPAVVNVLPGAPSKEFERERCMATLVANLNHAAMVMANLGVGVVLEPVNTRDRPDFFLSNSAEALSVIDWADHANVSLQYDVYHMQIMEGDLSATLERIIGRIGHTSSSPIRPVATSPARARSISRICSRPSIGSATTVGSAPNTTRAVRPRRHCPGWSRIAGTGKPPRSLPGTAYGRLPKL